MTDTTTDVPQAPTDATAYRWAPLSDGDVAAWTDLVNHLARVDDTEEFFQEDDLREELTQSGFDAVTDSLAVWDGDLMVAFTTVWAPVTTDHEGRARGIHDGGVREEYRRRGLGTELLDRMEARLADLVAQRHPGKDAYLRASGKREGSSASAMLTRRGYAVVRWFNLLERPLEEEPQVPVIEGVTLVNPREDQEEAVRLAHNEAFRDHWGSGPIAAESWHDHWTARAGRGEVSTLAMSAEGEVLAYVMCGEYQPREIYVNLVGTVPAARGRGIAAAALLNTIALAVRSGRYDKIQLDVDSDSPTGATRLYERVGFARCLQLSAMQRPLPL